MVSVIVPHYNDLAALDICLDHLASQSLASHLFEVVVADNASPQGTAAVEGVIAGRARLVVVHERGAGPARNGGVDAARGSILAFTDSDCRPEPDWLMEGLKGLYRYDFVGGRVRLGVDDPARMTGAEAFERVFAFNFKQYITRKRFTGSGNLFCARTVFERVGPFRVGVSEDVDWSHRALEAGFSLGYHHEAVIWHPARHSWAELKLKWLRVNRESFGLLSTGLKARVKWLGKSLLLPISAFAHAPKVLVSPELTNPRQRLLAIGTLFKLRFWRAWDALQLLFSPWGR